MGNFVRLQSPQVFGTWLAWLLLLSLFLSLPPVSLPSFQSSSSSSPGPPPPHKAYTHHKGKKMLLFSRFGNNNVTIHVNNGMQTQAERCWGIGKGVQTSNSKPSCLSRCCPVQGRRTAESVSNQAAQLQGESSSSQVEAGVKVRRNMSPVLLGQVTEGNYMGEVQWVSVILGGWVSAGGQKKLNCQW